MAYRYNTIEKVDKALKTHSGAEWFESIDPNCLNENEVIKLITFVRHLYKGYNGYEILRTHILTEEPFHSSRAIAEAFYKAFHYADYESFPFSDSIREDREIMLIAAKSDGRNLKYADAFTDDKAFTMTALEYSYERLRDWEKREAIERLSDRLQKDEDVKKLIAKIEKGQWKRLVDALKILAASTPDQKATLRDAGLLETDIDELGLAS